MSASVPPRMRSDNPSDHVRRRRHEVAGVVTNNCYRFLVAEQLAAIGVEADIMLEPLRRDSVPSSPPAVFAAKRESAPLVVAPPLITSSRIRRPSPKFAVSLPTLPLPIASSCLARGRHGRRPSTAIFTPARRY
jgi:hypothetical protein